MTDQPDSPFEARETLEVWESARGRGRPAEYETAEDLEAMVFDYLEWVKNNPLYELKAFGSGLMLNVPKKRYPTVAGCALHCGVTPRTWRYWGAENHRLSSVVEWAEEVMLQIKMEGAASGFFNSTIVARDVGLKDHSDVTGNLTVNVIDRFDDDGEDGEI